MTIKKKERNEGGGTIYRRPISIGGAENDEKEKRPKAATGRPFKSPDRGLAMEGIDKAAFFFLFLASLLLRLLFSFFRADGRNGKRET